MRRRLNDLAPGVNVTLTRAKGDEPCAWPAESVQVVFLDADHEEPGMRAHLAAWGPRVKRGGLLAGHDYHREDWPGVPAAVDAVLGPTERPTRTVWAWRKP